MSMDNRENVFTQFARDINLFCEHKLTKVDLFNRFVAYIEMCDEDEKNERIKFEKEMKEFEKLDTYNMLRAKLPYSNYEEAKKMLE